MTRLVLLLILAVSSVQADGQDGAASGFITLENDKLRAVIAPEQGGELSGFAVNLDGSWHELLYRAMDYSKQTGWRGKAPLLWPATGVSYTTEKGKGHYVLDGKHRPMPSHGFARDLPWRVVERQETESGTSVTLEITGAEAMRDSYPFEFALRVKYHLEQQKLRVVYTVDAAAANSRPMPFSIGNHITFRAPLVAGGEPGNVRFKNEFPDMLVRDENNAFSGTVVPSPVTGWQELSVLPRRKAVSLGGPPGQARLTVLDPSGLQIQLVHQTSQEPAAPVVRFNLWADTEEGFFSPEPWLGTQNSLNSGAGLLSLDPGQTWTWQIEITPSRAQRPGGGKTED